MPIIIPDRQTLERTIRRYVSDGSGLDRSHVVPIAQTAPRHADPYAVVGLIRDDMNGTESEKVRYASNGDIEFVETTTQRTASYDISFYRDTSYADLFSRWMVSAGGVIAADTYKIRAHQYGNVMRLDEIIDEAWEQRSVVQCQFIYNSIYRDERIGDLRVSRIIISHDGGTESVSIDDSN